MKDIAETVLHREFGNGKTRSNVDSLARAMRPQTEFERYAAGLKDLVAHDAPPELLAHYLVHSTPTKKKRK